MESPRIRFTKGRKITLRFERIVAEKYKKAKNKELFAKISLKFKI
jgi:hypothetical protein